MYTLLDAKMREDQNGYTGKYKEKGGSKWIHWEIQIESRIKIDTLVNLKINKDKNIYTGGYKEAGESKWIHLVNIKRKECQNRYTGRYK